MSNILAALLGGAGAGAQSYGGSLQREQEQQRMQAQRMAEMQQAEASRRRLAKEDDDRAAALKVATRTAGGESIRALFPDFKAPEGDYNPDLVMRSMLDRETTNRANTRQSGEMERLERTLGGRIDAIREQGGISREIAGMRGDTSRAIAAIAEAGRNARDDGPDPVKDPRAEWTTKRYTDLLKPDGDGVSISPDSAMRRSRNEAEPLFGKSAASMAPAAPSYNSGEQDIMQGLSAAIANINKLPISSDDKRSRIQEASEIARGMAAKQRGGR